MALGSNVIVKKDESALLDGRELIAGAETTVVENAVESEDIYHVDIEEEVVEERIMLVVFPINDVSYALSIDQVREIVPMPKVIELPQVADHILGAANIRGNVFTVIDLSLKKGFGNSRKKGSNHVYAIVIRDDIYKVAIAMTEMPRTVAVLHREFGDLSSIAVQNDIEKANIKSIVRKGKELVMSLDIIEIIKNSES